MLTPVFELVQDNDTLTIIIKAPMTKVSETEIFIEEDEFKFYSKPYFLRLHLPGNVIENGTESAKYDAEEGQFVIKIPKQKRGEHFEGLDLITKLLAPKKYANCKAPLIEVLGTAQESVVPPGGDTDDNDGDEIDWQIEQIAAADDTGHVISPLHQYSYGFANRHQGAVTARILEEYPEALDLRFPEQTSPSERRRQRMDDENRHFDPEYYLADLYTDDQIIVCLSHAPDWEEQYQMMRQGQDPDKFIQLTEDERRQLRELPRREYLIEGGIRSAIYLGLVDLMFAYAYDKRTTGGEGSVESGWTIRKLSSTLSWFEVHTSLKHVVVAACRRSLTYPVYRNWELTSAVLRDTKRIVKLGRKRILQCLLDIHNLLRVRDPFFLLNDLYITDYCAWIQQASGRKLSHLARALHRISIDKDDLELELNELERAAELALESANDDDSENESADDESESEQGTDCESEQGTDSESNEERLVTDLTALTLVEVPGLAEVSFQGTSSVADTPGTS